MEKRNLGKGRKIPLEKIFKNIPIVSVESLSRTNPERKHSFTDLFIKAENEESHLRAEEESAGYVRNKMCVWCCYGQIISAGKVMKQTDCHHPKADQLPATFSLTPHHLTKE